METRRKFCAADLELIDIRLVEISSNLGRLQIYLNATKVKFSVINSDKSNGSPVNKKNTLSSWVIPKVPEPEGARLQLPSISKTLILLALCSLILLNRRNNEYLVSNRLKNI